MKIEVQGISKKFGRFPALHEVNLTVPSGKLVALLGPSGSGKTTLLRIIAGLEFGDTGRILFDGRDVTELPAGKRQVGFVFQHYALFRHLTVFRNITFGLDVRPRRLRPSPVDAAKRVAELLKLVQLEGLESRFPPQLSGGQRQRIALARALAVEPKVLLLDEPFGALDAKVRKDLRRWLREFHERVHITTLFVTHDQEEALELADEVVVLHEGRIQQIGTPEQIYHQPANEFVHTFLGNVNELPGSGGTLRVRPHEILIGKNEEGGLVGTVVNVHAAGPVVRVLVRVPDRTDPVLVELSQREHSGLGLVENDRVTLSY
ncbi:MAG: sulfate ABC transporter ATP-binding protein [Chthoniobacterales bacterium]|nr:sulfate ABC transporter ATP-binding protein [Chthoniobacterales bacterium]